jgi:hypothetical protein
VIAALVHGTGYERLTSPGCSDRTIRRRLTEWAQAGLGQQLLRIGTAYNQMIGRPSRMNPGPCAPLVHNNT